MLCSLTTDNCILFVAKDMVRGEGLAEGRESPPFLPIGSDAFGKVKDHSEITLDIPNEWEDAINFSSIQASQYTRCVVVTADIGS